MGDIWFFKETKTKMDRLMYLEALRAHLNQLIEAQLGGNPEACERLEEDIGRLDADPSVHERH